MTVSKRACLRRRKKRTAKARLYLNPNKYTVRSGRAVASDNIHPIDHDKNN